MGAGGETREKPTVTRVTHLLLRVFVWCFIQTTGGWAAPPWDSAGSQVERREMGGEFSPRSPTVLTAAHWSDVASSLKHDPAPAVQAGVWGCRAERAGKWACQTWGQKRHVRRRVMSKFHSALSYLQTPRVSCLCEASFSTLCVCICENSPHLCLCAQQLLHQPEDRCTQTLDILPIHRQMSLLNQMMVFACFNFGGLFPCHRCWPSKTSFLGLKVWPKCKSHFKSHAYTPAYAMSCAGYISNNLTSLFFFILLYLFCKQWKNC